MLIQLNFISYVLGELLRWLFDKLHNVLIYCLVCHHLFPSLLA